MKYYFSLGALLFSLFFIASLSYEKVCRYRYCAAASIAPLLTNKSPLKEKTFSTCSLEKLSLENQLLHSQLESLYERLLFDKKLEEDFDKIKNLSPKETLSKDFFLRRNKELRALVEQECFALAAKILFREPSSWGSSLWVNVGEENNRLLGKKVVARNSPVVLGSFLVGVVDFVGEKQSLVRLITDSSCVPSVRALRGASQDRASAEIAKALFQRLSNREELFSSQEKKKQFFCLFSEMIQLLSKEGKDDYLAKGELYGMSQPLWRSRKTLLKGVGFNYDFADEEGPARDLRTGAPLSSPSKEKKPLLQEGDLLVTTGLDGIFPAGLKVATISKVEPFKEGDFAYEIEAEPLIPHIDELNTLFILPSSGFEKEK